MKFWAAMPLTAKIFIPGLAAVIFVATIKPAPIAMPPVPVVLPHVVVVYAKPDQHRLKVRSQGTVAPRREIDLVAQVGGRVTEVENTFVDGGFFSEAQALIQIDDRDYSVAHKRAEARVAEAQQVLSTERGRVRQAKREWRDLGNSEANALFLRKPQLAAARASLASAEADLSKAALDLERTRISVPFAGRIRETYVDLGQYVTPGTRIATVYDTGSAEIRLPLSDRQAALVDLPLGFNAKRGEAGELIGPRVMIEGVVGTKTYRWEGTITRTDASIDTRSRMYYAVAEVENPFIAATDRSRAVPLIVGLFVEAEIDGRLLHDVVALPRNAVFKRDRIYWLQSKTETSKANTGKNTYTLVEQRVQVLHKTATRIWVKARAGESIAVATAIVSGGQNYLSAGVSVTIAEPLLIESPIDVTPALSETRL